MRETSFPVLETGRPAGRLPRFGALPHEEGVRFCVWAPKAGRVALVLEDAEGEPIAMEDAGGHTFVCDVPGLKAGARYRYQLGDGQRFPDPASRFQPDGVHGPSVVVDPAAYAWGDAAWQGTARKDLVFYELHVGTFTPEGTFRGVQDRLPYLKDLGVTAVELMPVAGFPGRWNWGYDPATLYAPSHTYGTPDDLRALVDAAHQLGLAVFLDVVYNHLGPDGAYVAAFAPMFTEKHETPWGAAVNLDDTHSEGVRAFFIDSALHWLREYHFDGIRLDATHTLVDDGPRHFLAELAEAVAALGEPRRYLIAEDARNLNTLVRAREQGGYGLDGVWADDFHHQIRHVAAGDAESYFKDFVGTTAEDIARTLERGWFFEGQVSPFQNRPRGTTAEDVAWDQCVICIQNHDQVGNRPAGNRLTDDVPLNVYRAVSALLLFAPEVPLLFMGQEWAAGTPFQFFTDHNETLGPLVTKGRKAEFKDFPGFEDEVPDPQDPATFAASRLDWSEPQRQPHAGILELYRRLLALRPALPQELEVGAYGDHGLVLQRGAYSLLVALSGGVSLPLPEGAGVVWHTEEPAFARDGVAPERQGGQLFFQIAGAALART